MFVSWGTVIRRSWECGGHGVDCGDQALWGLMGEVELGLGSRHRQLRSLVL